MQVSPSLAPFWPYGKAALWCIWSRDFLRPRLCLLAFHLLNMGRASFLLACALCRADNRRRTVFWESSICEWAYSVYPLLQFLSLLIFLSCWKPPRLYSKVWYIPVPFNDSLYTCSSQMSISECELFSLLLPKTFMAPLHLPPYFLWNLVWMPKKPERNKDCHWFM